MVFSFNDLLTDNLPDPLPELLGGGNLLVLGDCTALFQTLQLLNKSRDNFNL